MRRREVRRQFVSNLLRNSTIYGISILVAFVVVLTLSLLLGYDTIAVLRTLTTTSLRSAFGFQETIKKTIPLIFTTYAFTVPFLCCLFNIGGWGQMLFGGAMTTVVGLSLRTAAFPAYIMIPLLLLVGAISGGAFAWIAGYLKAKSNVDPIVSTIMLNWVAWQFVNLVATTPPFKDPAEGYPITNPLPESATLGYFGGIPHSIVLAVLVIVFVNILLKRTKLGYEITSVGNNLFAAQTFGINVGKTIMVAFFIGGACAGLGGSIEVMNTHGKLLEGFTATSGAEYGVFGILVSLVIAGNPTSVPLAAFLMAVLLVGADACQRTIQLPVEMVFLIQALIVLAIIIVREKLRKGDI